MDFPRIDLDDESPIESDRETQPAPPRDAISSQFLKEFLLKVYSAGSLDQLSVDVLFERQINKYSNEYSGRIFANFHQVIEKLNYELLAETSYVLQESTNSLTGIKWYTVRSNLYNEGTKPLSQVCKKTSGDEAFYILVEAFLK